MTNPDFSQLRVALVSAVLVCSGCAAVAPLPGLANDPVIAQAPVTAVSAPVVHTVLASAGTTTESEKLACPGIGFATCEVNWQPVEQGWSQYRVLEQLGQPASESEPQIYINEVLQQWDYKGGTIEFRNDHVISVVAPEAFDFPAEDDASEKQSELAG